MKLSYLISALALVGLGAFIVGSVAQGAYCHLTATDFILNGVNYGNNASNCTREGSAWGLMFLIPSILFIHVPLLFTLRSVFEGVRPAILFILLPAVPYTLLVWLLFGSFLLPVLGVSSLMFGLGSQLVLAGYDKRAEKREGAEI